ncbi:hypothetical protein AAVH_33171 [Aphelenchoides avenae]|nr:hypothetical protein AAVH_33171 [Aphelenchus avenae]
MATPMLTLVFAALIASIYGADTCPSGHGDIETVCDRACRCSCAGPALESCMIYCRQAIQERRPCEELPGGDPFSEVKDCPLTDYSHSSVCAQVCSCCGVQQCSCHKSVHALLWTNACPFIS